ncbi:MAG TPA: hypothetical protein VHD88_07920 [Pyrinomonadaceae bacterium]|nr:hypothetical protein [Pyrinomonadaceae bacterium]
MHRPNFCAECGARLARKGWRAWIGGRVCGNCARRVGKTSGAKLMIAVVVLAVAAFALGRYLRPAPPPLIVERAANSPLSDLPVNLNDAAKSGSRNPKSQNEGAQSSDDPATHQTSTTASSDDVVFICGARTKKGTPCHRRVHFAGERCYQHKGMPAILPLEKLVVRP